ncbi:MAG: Hsp20 family protein [Dichotomicrobium sp.]
MRRFDLTPLYKSTVGFDHVASILEQLAAAETDNGYPPYNIERVDENNYRITMAVAGFGENDLDIEIREGTLRIAGNKPSEAEQGESETVFLHRGIAARNFERRFRLAEHVEVNGAKLENGLLHIDLRRELPDAMKPRKIEIANANANGQATIEARAGQVN